MLWCVPQQPTEGRAGLGEYLEALEPQLLKAAGQDPIAAWEGRLTSTFMSQTHLRALRSLQTPGMKTPRSILEVEATP